jgi:hypothetical protein
MAQRNLGLKAGVLTHFGFLIFQRQGTFYPVAATAPALKIA